MSYKRIIAIKNQLEFYWEIVRQYFIIRISLLINRKRCVLMGAPWYGNLGDQAILLGEIKILTTIFPSNKIIVIPALVSLSLIARRFGIGIRHSDVLYLQGGGNLGTLYLNEEEFRRMVIKRYSQNQIVIMPVSIYFHDDKKCELEISKKLYNKHLNLTIISRDRVSYDFSLKHFNMVHNILAPDAALALDGVLQNIKIKRTGVCLFLRNDQEKCVDEELIHKIERYLCDENICYNISDTVVKRDIYHNCKFEVLKCLWMARKARMVITDRYHGLIFSVITRTPVLVFKSYDTKISSGVKWFNNLNYVHYMDGKCIDDIQKLISYYCGSDEVMINSNAGYCKQAVIEAVKKTSFFS